ncbi:hypothetical protein K470DRAFT_276160 [Piedraia hortae CBS 480.64]|uniref:Uncharacterized protein n=1 Tax=Piedraia hortae CBS 480.64 TaxID=1314780 RepID=A0A6A7C1X7_9PEZI|nr:hypothetical protein K470DRAFT_276160 [Piedraia hortae CBS 480.64]
MRFDHIAAPTLRHHSLLARPDDSDGRCQGNCCVARTHRPESSPGTHAAVLYAVEEGFRFPHTLTPDLDEENSQMSEVGARATHTGARPGGPVPISAAAPSIRTPRDVMRERNAREARRFQAQREEEARRHVALSSEDGLARDGSVRVSGAEALGEPVSRSQGTQNYASNSRPRRISGASGGKHAPQNHVATSFPLAFERWETLSSHWEGLTSYWLHKLEQNTEEIRHTVPNVSSLNRQITDLSAAGANLFHAVVELQRLRASSERKFQRWFFDTRAETERNAERQAELERQLQLERGAHEEAASRKADAEAAASQADRELRELRRELIIAKEEARRAWEELGKRNDEALQQAENLKSGCVAVVAGVQVVPYVSRVSRSGTVASAVRPDVTSSPGERHYERYASPTNTDPFAELARQTVPQTPPWSAERRAGVRSPASSAYTQPHYATDGTPTHVQPNVMVTSPTASPHTRSEGRQEGPFTMGSEAETVYAIDSAGQLQSPPAAITRDTEDTQISESGYSDYGSLPTLPATSAEAMATFTPSSGPDDFADWDTAGATTHHHPTRLSDVLEEDEERSSRRTAE